MQVLDKIETYALAGFQNTFFLLVRMCKKHQSVKRLRQIELGEVLSQCLTLEQVDLLIISLFRLRHFTAKCSKDSHSKQWENEQRILSHSQNIDKSNITF